MYTGIWRGCDVAVKKPVDPRAAQDPELKEDFKREVCTKFVPNLLQTQYLIGSSRYGSRMQHVYVNVYVT